MPNCDAQRNQLDALLAGLLPVSAAESLRAHLAECDSCRNSLDQRTDQPELHDWFADFQPEKYHVSGVGNMTWLTRQFVPALQRQTSRGDDTVHAAAASETIGTVIGPYRLLQRLGEGGMGTVWVAEQAVPVKRHVALKVSKQGMDSAQVIRRFEAERQALALMDHTNIAKVLDAGITASGRPYFAMELVHGVPVTRYCDELNLPIGERLALFVLICQAIQHAHQKGIIHRDIKPSNVLVCIQDGQPVPKVIDFGVAKAMHQKLTDGTLFTEFGAVIGTLEYMSPEQAEMSPLGVDTRADIYALGVLLFELLTGSTPLNRQRLKSVSVLESLRIIREEEPPKPSTLLTSSKDTLLGLATRRRTQPVRLTRQVRGELDWIVMKCLEKDRTRRYETASGLASDVQHYLDNEPVDACPPSKSYRLKKFLRRNKGPVLAAAAVLLVLVGGIVGTSWGLVKARLQWNAATANAEHARQERDRAESEKRVAQAVRDFLRFKLLRQADATEQANALRLGGSAEQEVRQNLTVRELLDRAANELVGEKLERTFPKQPAVQAEILQTLGQTYLGIGEYARAISHLERSGDLQGALLGPEHADTLLTMSNLALAYREADKLPEAIRLFEQVQNKQVETLGAAHPDTMTTVRNLAGAYWLAGKLSEAIKLYEQVRDVQGDKFGPDDPNTLAALHIPAGVYHAGHSRPEAIRVFHQVWDERVAKLGPDHPDTLTALNSLAEAYHAAYKLPEAIRLFEQVRDQRIEKLGPDHPSTLITLHNLAAAYGQVGKLSEAIQLNEEARDKQIAKLGPDHADTLATQNNLARMYKSAGKLPEAIQLFEQVRDQRIAKLGPDHPSTLITLHDLGVAYMSSGRLPEAIRLLEQVRVKEIERLGLNHPDTLRTLYQLAGAYRADGKLPEALRLCEEGVPEAGRVLGPAHPHAINFTRRWCDVLDQAREFTKAAGIRRELLVIERKEYPADDTRLATALAPLGLSLFKAEQFADAELVLQECLAIRERQEPDHWRTFSTKATLGDVLLSQKKYAEAEPLLRQGYEGMKHREAEIPTSFRAVRLTEALQRLINLYTDWDKLDEAAKWRRIDREREAPELSATNLAEKP